jgi:hypothetical protein
VLHQRFACSSVQDSTAISASRRSTAAALGGRSADQPALARRHQYANPARR